MDKPLERYLQGEGVNCVIPFYWQHGEEKRTVSIPEKLREIHSCGIDSVCVESRPHPDFAGDGWWADMDVLMSEAEALGMRVWLLDDDHYPTGHANGAVRQHPELRAWHVAEKHLDVMGPLADGLILLSRYAPGDVVLGVFAYPRVSRCEEELGDDPIDLSDGVDGDLIHVSLPAGAWRIFILLQTRKSVLESYVDMLNPDSVRLLIDAVHEPHFARYQKYVGKTFMGFFSDEPRFRNRPVGPTRQFCGYYWNNIGMPGMGLPWSEEVRTELSRRLGRDAISCLPALWYRMGGSTAKIRYCYMDLVTELYRKYFSLQLGDWCRDHGLLYMGHIVEDMGCHARLGNGPGHFYRSMAGQDFCGMDLVLAQVIPGLGQYDNMTTADLGYAFSDFNHCVLPQMCNSAARTDPRKQGRSVCELFGAYGWAESVPDMKWQIDFLLARGINHFVPHAFDDFFPDPDCPPQFGADGQDPQLEGFGHLMRYTRRVAGLLSEGRQIANAAILYHAEGMWMNPEKEAMDMSVPARVLDDAHIGYSILPLDTLAERSTVRGGKLVTEGETRDILLIPYARHLPEKLKDTLSAFAREGLPILFVGGTPEGFDGIGTEIPPEDVAKECLRRGFFDIRTDRDFPLLQSYHLRRGETDVYFLFNENTADVFDGTVAFPVSGLCTVIDDAGGSIRRVDSPDGVLTLRLEPYESRVLLWNAEDEKTVAAERPAIIEMTPSKLSWEISLAESRDMGTFVPYRVTDTLFPVSGRGEKPDFSGLMRYRTVIRIPADGSYLLDLGRVGETASVAWDGEEIGFRMCHPYRFGFETTAGEHTLTVTVANTLFNRMQDELSCALAVQASGLLGPVRVFREQKDA